MPTFQYTAIDARGKERSGTIQSASVEQASADLRTKGYFPTAMQAVNGDVPAGKDTKKSGSAALNQAVTGTPAAKKSFGRVISPKGLALFTRQLATLTQAGMPIVRALDVLGRQERNPSFKTVLTGLSETIKSGSNFSDGLLQHPKVFDRLYINMVKAGEAGGVLEVVLERLAKFQEKAERIKGKVKAAMTYPVIIMFVAVTILIALMTFVVPKFEAIFKDMLKGAALPPLTQGVLAVSNFIKNNFIVTFLACVAIYIAINMFRKTPTGARIVDKLSLRIPVLGDLTLKAAVARFARTFGTLLSSGVPILQALTITRDTSGNVVLVEAINVVHDRVKEGDNVAIPLESTNVFPGMVTSMIQVGEETGSLPDMLTRIADIYDEEVDNAVSALTSIIEPIMIVFLAVVVGIIVIALFMPIIKLIQNLS